MAQKFSNLIIDTLPVCVYRPPCICLAVILFATPCLAQSGAEETGQNESRVTPAVSQAPLGAGPESSGAPKPDRQQALVDEINGLRQRLGGGVASQLEELFPDSQQAKQELQQDFNHHLRGLAEAAAVAVPVLADPAKRSRSVGRPQSNVALRAAARQLDGVAADLEDHGFYESADRLRSEAASLRQLAR